MCFAALPESLHELGVREYICALTTDAAPKLARWKASPLFTQPPQRRKLEPHTSFQ